MSINLYAENSNEIFVSQVLDLHKCTEEELGLDESGNSKFYPINEEYYNNLANIKELFYCFDHSSVQIMNNWTTNRNKVLSIFFRIPASNCSYDTNTLECVPNVE